MNIHDIKIRVIEYITYEVLILHWQFDSQHTLVYIQTT